MENEGSSRRKSAGTSGRDLRLGELNMGQRSGARSLYEL